MKIIDHTRVSALQDHLIERTTSHLRRLCDRRAGPRRRLRRERRTLTLMIQMYCRDHHFDKDPPAHPPARLRKAFQRGDGIGRLPFGHSSVPPEGSRVAAELTVAIELEVAAESLAPTKLCPDCAALLDYALARLAACPFGAQKPVCARCSVHCYRPTKRHQVRAAMRYAGPHMTWRHPYLALRHLLDRRREPPPAGRAR